MTAAPATKARIAAELERIEEDCIHSGKAQFNAGDRWRHYHYWLGIPSVMFSAIAGTAFFQEQAEWGGALASAAGILTALITFLKPSERASAHKSAGDQYLALRNDARVYREISLEHACDDEAALAGLDEFTKRRNAMNLSSTQVAKRDFEKARAGINAGEAAHAVDKGATDVRP